MNTMEYIEERKRMCESFNYGCGCQMCPACDNDLCCAVSVMSTLDAAEQVAMVEKWSIEHPKKQKKTRQDVFLEQYPEAMIDNNGVLSLCPAVISNSYRDSRGKCLCISRECADCLCEFWAQEVEEDK